MCSSCLLFCVDMINNMVTKRTTLLQALAAMPRLAAQLVGDMAQSEGEQSSPSPEDSIGGWLTYLLEVESYHQAAFRRIVEEEHPHIQAIELDNPAHLPDLSSVDLLHKLQAARAETIYFLSHLPSSTWTRLATHEKHGCVPLVLLVQHLMNYDRLHLNQLATMQTNGNKNKESSC